MSDIQNELRRKGQLELGEKLLMYGGEWMLLKVGDSYLAHVEGEEPEFLTVRRIEVQKRRTGLTEGKVFPKERKKKLYNLHEVIKVTVIDNPNPSKEKKDERNPQLPVPGPGRVQRREPGEEERDVPRQDGPQPRKNRPVPGPPRRAGATDYTAASSRAVSGPREAEDGDRRAGRLGGDRPS